jgi:hypothetical protein
METNHGDTETGFTWIRLDLVRFIGIWRGKLGRELPELTRIEPDRLIQKRANRRRTQAARISNREICELREQNRRKPGPVERADGKLAMGNSHEWKNSQRSDLL